MLKMNSFHSTEFTARLDNSFRKKRIQINFTQSCIFYISFKMKTIEVEKNFNFFLHSKQEN